MKWDKIKTAFAYAKNVFTTGAFVETSRGTEVEICSRLPRESGKIIVEYGMGHGNISREILRVIAPDAQLYCFEINADFCEYVRQNITDERLIIINDTVENAKKHLPPQVDAIVASLPYTFFPKEVGQQIIQDAYHLLTTGGYYSQVLYRKYHIKKFAAIFDACTSVKIPAFPIEYVFHCQKKKS